MEQLLPDGAVFNLVDQAYQCNLMGVVGHVSERLPMDFELSFGEFTEQTEFEANQRRVDNQRQRRRIRRLRDSGVLTRLEAEALGWRCGLAADGARHQMSDFARRRRVCVSTVSRTLKRIRKKLKSELAARTCRTK